MFCENKYVRLNLKISFNKTSIRLAIVLHVLLRVTTSD